MPLRVGAAGHRHDRQGDFYHLAINPGTALYPAAVTTIKLLATPACCQCQTAYSSERVSE